MWFVKRFSGFQCGLSSGLVASSMVCQAVQWLPVWFVKRFSGFQCGLSSGLVASSVVCQVV